MEPLLCDLLSIQIPVRRPSVSVSSPAASPCPSKKFSEGETVPKQFGGGYSTHIPIPHKVKSLKLYLVHDLGRKPCNSISSKTYLGIPRYAIIYLLLLTMS